MKRFQSPLLQNPLAIGVVSVCLLLMNTLTISAQTRRRNVDWVFVLDTSASMMGVGGSKNIFSDVKHTLQDFIGKTQEGDTVSLYTFDSDTDTQRGTRLITSDQDRGKLVDEIDKLIARGSRTHTGKALKDALELSANLQKRPDASDRTITIVLLSDGKEDTRGLSNPVPIPDLVKLVPDKPPYLFYVSLGEYDPGIKQVEQKFGSRYRELRPNNPAEIDAAIDQIRKTAIAPPPPEFRFTIEPHNIDFGRIEPGSQTPVKTITIKSNQTTRSRIDLKNLDGLVLATPDEVELVANEASTVKVRLAAAKDVKDQTFNGTLTVTPIDPPSGAVIKPASTQLTLQTAYDPIWRKIIKWLALLVLLIIIALGALTLIKGETPWDLWKKVKADKNLEGELEFMSPRPAQPGEEFVSLLQRGTERLALSSLVPNGASDGSDAELVAVRKNKQKTIQLHRTLGSVHVNKVEVATTELFDGDLIELGSARLRFNWIGHERPSDGDESESL